MFWSDSRPCSNGGKKGVVSKAIAIGAAALCIVLFLAGIIWWKGCFRGRLQKKEGEASVLFIIYKAVFCQVSIREVKLNFERSNYMCFIWVIILCLVTNLLGNYFHQNKLI